MSTLFNEDFIVKHGLVVGTTATILSTATSISSTTGALIVSGGIGVSGNIQVGGTLHVQSVDLLAYDPDSIYVSESTGNDTTGDGRRVQSAYRTIKKALTVATTGTKVHVDAGTYFEEFPLTLPAGVTVQGSGLRATTIKPTTATNTQTCFFLNGETTVNDLSIQGFYKPGYAFKFAPNCKVTTRSPYVERVTVLTRGSITSPSDPYGFDAADAGGGAYLDASVLDRTSLEPAMLWNEVTMIVPNATGWYMTNGARAELLNGFSYFADKSIHTVSTPVGYGGDGKTKLRFDGVTGVFTPGDTLYYKDVNGNTLASGVIESTATGGYVYIDGPAWGFEEITFRSGKTVTGYNSIAQSTTQKKFGASSSYFSGSSQYLGIASSADFAYTSGTNFCFEAWVYPTTTGTYRTLFDLRSTTGDTSGIIVGLSDLAGLYLYYNGNYRIGPAGVVSSSTWSHIAISRDGTSTRAFVNGVQVGSTYTDSNSYPERAVKIGADPNASFAFTGYIDEVRITKGNSRYTGTFTPATSAFVSDDATKLLLHFDSGNGSTVFIDDALGAQNIYSTGSAYTATASRCILADYHQFGAELRCIGSAAVFGTYGVIADGTGTNLKLIAYNLSHIGSGKDLSDDISLVVQANEIVQTNGGRIYYQTIDQNGDFRVGDGFLINQRTGNVSFGEVTVNIANLPNLTITDGVNSTVINPTNIQVGNLNLQENTISSISGNITISPANGQVVINSNLQVGSDITATNFHGTLIGSSNNLTGGIKGEIPYQTAPSTTAFIGTGTEYSLLRMGTESTATFVSSSSVQVGFSANLLGGQAGYVAYQSTGNATAFVGTSSIGNILVSKGDAAPEFASTTTIYVYRATIADSASGGSATANNLSGGTAGQVPYQVSPSVTGFFGPGTAGQLLVSSGTNAPVYFSTASIYVKDADISTNLRGGQVGVVPYQTGGDTTGFSNVGAAGDLLMSGGAAAPIFTSTTTIYVGRALVADTALSSSGSGSSTQVNTQQRTTDASHFALFVDTNNSVATPESVYTTSSFRVNPGTGFLSVGTAQGYGKLTVSDTASTTLSLERISGDAAAPEAVFQKARGTEGAKSGVLLNDNLGFIGAGGYVGTEGAGGGYSGTKAGINFIASENWTGGSQGAAITFATTEVAQTSKTDKVIITGEGFLGVGNLTPTARLDVSGGVILNGITTVTNATSVHNTTTGALRVQGGLAVHGGGFFSGAVTATNFIGSVSGTSDTANNLAGGLAGSIPYQSAPSVTTFVGIGANNSILVSNGSAPSWTINPTIGGNLTIVGNLTVQGTTVVVDSTVTNVSDPIITIGTGPNNTPPTTDDGKDRGIAFWWHNGSNARTGFFGFDRSTEYFSFYTSATIINEVVVPAGGTTRAAIDANLAGGLANDVVYQIAPNVTGFISTSSLYVGRALVADSAASSTGNSGSADQVKTVTRNTQATHFLTFVNSDNTVATNENVYTTATVTVDPSNSYVGVGVQSASSQLHVRGVSGELLRIDAFQTQTGAIDTGPQQHFYGHDGVQSRPFASIVVGKENATSGNRAAYFAVRTMPNGGSLTERFRVDSFGNFGINTVTPITTLDVNGGARFSGITTVTNVTSVHDTSTGALQVAGGLAVAGGGFFGGTVTATNFIGAVSGSSSQVTTQQRTTNASHFVTFVDSNNASALAEALYTTSSLAVNPGTRTVTIDAPVTSVSTTTGALQIVNGGIGVGDSVYVKNRVGFVNASNVSAVYQVYNAATNSLDTVFA